MTPEALTPDVLRQLVALVRIGFLVTVGDPPRRADLLDVGANPYSDLLSDILTATDTDAAVTRVAGRQVAADPSGLRAEAPDPALAARFARALHGAGMCRCPDETNCHSGKRFASLVGEYDPNRDVPRAATPRPERSKP